MRALSFDAVKNPNKMINYWKKEWPVVLVIILTGTVYNSFLFAGPVLQGRIIDALLAERKAADVLWLIGRFLLVIVSIQGMRFLKRYYVRVFANRTGATMRKMVYNNIIHMDTTVLHDEKTGDLMTKAISDVSACVEGMRKFTTEVFDTGVLMVSYFITMMYYDVLLTLCACIFIPVAMVIAEKLKNIIYKYTKEYRAQLSEVSEMTYETVENSMLYRICSAEQTILKRYNESLVWLEKKAVISNMLENSMQPVYTVIAMTGVAVIIYLGAKNVAGGAWTVGEFSAYLTIFSALAIKASKAAKLINSVQKAQVSWNRIQPYLTEYVSDDKNDFDKSEYMLLCLESVSFAYPGSEKTIIKNVSFTARTGQLIGITGPVASGKSSIGLALLGLYPYSGNIFLNNRELRDYSKGEISCSISYMGHESQLLSDTIYRNITLGDEGDVMPVLRDVCFDSDLKNMPLGVETLVGASGIRLSGGQQARLALARALYRKSPILVLDDPFSSVDMKTEKQIIHNIKQHYKECIIILISHRVSSFEAADTVVVVKDGCTVCGTHEQMIEASEVYRSIFTIQKEGEAHE